MEPGGLHPVLNWSDGEASLGGSVLRPPKQVWLMQTPGGDVETTFEVLQVFDSIVRRALARVGGKTERKLDELPTMSEGDRRRSVYTWNVPVPTGLRLRALYEFRNGRGVASPRLLAHKLGEPRVDAKGGADVGLEHLLGVPIGLKGEGGIEMSILFATDPAVRVSVLQAGEGGSDSIERLLLEYFEDVRTLLPDGVDPDVALGACREIFGDFMPGEPNPKWTFEDEQLLEGDEGDVVPFTIRLNLSEPGRSLVGVQVTDVSHPSLVAVSEIFALEVTEALEIRLLKGAEIGAEELRLVYRQGKLDAADLQAEIDRMWSSLAEDPELSAAVRASGIDIDELPELAPPVRVLEKAAGIDPNSLLLVAAGGAARDLLREIILPRIRARFGADAIRQEQPAE